MLTDEMKLTLGHASAAWGEWQGCTVPMHFGDSQREQAELASGWGVTDLTCLGLIALSGRDTEDYLSRQLTNRVKGLEPGEGCRAAALRGDGTMVGEMTVHRLAADDFLCVCPPSCADALAEHFDRFIFAEKIKIGRWDNSHGLLSCQGGEVAQHLAPLLGEERMAFTPGSSREATIGGIEVVALGSGLFGVPGVHLVAAREDLPTLWKSLVTAGAVPVGIDALTTARIERGVPMFGEDHDENWIPNDAGLEDLLDYEKGCFPGQEVVAKIHNIGHPRRVLRGFLVDGDEIPAPGTRVLGEGGEVGTISSAVRSPRLGRIIALGHLKWRSGDVGQTVKLGDREGSRGSARVVALPFEEPA